MFQKNIIFIFIAISIHHYVAKVDKAKLQEQILNKTFNQVLNQSYIYCFVV
jgi:hypothetical protein